MKEGGIPVRTIRRTDADGRTTSAKLAILHSNLTLGRVACSRVMLLAVTRNLPVDSGRYNFLLQSRGDQAMAILSNLYVRASASVSGRGFGVFSFVPSFDTERRRANRMGRSLPIIMICVVGDD